jgi:hypothetical protein
MVLHQLVPIDKVISLVCCAVDPRGVANDNFDFGERDWFGTLRRIMNH